MQATIVAALVAVALFGLNAWQFKRNGALSEKLSSAEKELVHVRKDAVRLAEADKKHRHEIDGLRGKARLATVAVAGIQGGCWDSDAGDSAVDALRMLNGKPDRKTAAAASSAAADGS